ARPRDAQARYGHLLQAVKLASGSNVHRQRAVMMMQPAEPIQALYYDPNSLDRRQIRDILQASGRRSDVTETDDLGEFVRHLATGRFDLVLSELASGTGDALRVVDLVTQRDPPLPLAIVTGSGSESIAVD